MTRLRGIFALCLMMGFCSSVSADVFVADPENDPQREDFYSNLEVLDNLDADSQAALRREPAGLWMPTDPILVAPQVAPQQSTQ